MKSLREMKYLLLDLDGVCYGKHNNYSLEKVFGQVSKRMTSFISERLKINLNEAKQLQTDYFYKYNTSLNGLMIRRPPRSTHCISSAASDVYKRQNYFRWHDTKN